MVYGLLKGSMMALHFSVEVRNREYCLAAFVAFKATSVTGTVDCSSRGLEFWKTVNM
jgi:hypothetical protein